MKSNIRRTALALKLVLICVLSSCSTAKKEEPVAVEPRCCIDKLSAEQIKALEERAAKEDVLAIGELATYYAFQGPESEYEKWNKKALEIGAPGAHIANASKNFDVAKYGEKSKEKKIFYFLEAKKSYTIALKNKKYNIYSATTPEDIKESIVEIDQEIAKLK